MKKIWYHTLAVHLSEPKQNQWKYVHYMYFHNMTKDRHQFISAFTFTKHSKTSSTTTQVRLNGTLFHWLCSNHYEGDTPKLFKLHSKVM